MPASTPANRRDDPSNSTVEDTPRHTTDSASTPDCRTTELPNWNTTYCWKSSTTDGWDAPGGNRINRVTVIADANVITAHDQTANAIETSTLRPNPETETMPPFQ